MNKYTLLGLTLVLALIVATTIAVQKHFAPKPQHHPALGQVLPTFELVDLEGVKQSSKQWDNKVRLINFWAAWCPPCRREIPEFADVYEFYADQGFVVVGIAIDELEAVKQFLSALPQVKYPQLIGMSDAVEVARQMGNKDGGLPYSIIADRNGVVKFIKQGELKKETLLQWVEALLE